ncbi:MAG: hypothetical protein K6G01_05060 [Eubacterium sp.]|nr:hypothetical protein [Eubacterium sp.]
MRGKKYNKLLAVVLATVMIFGLKCGISIQASEINEITTREELVDALEEVNEDGTVTETEQLWLEEQTDEELMDSFVEEKLEDAERAFEEVEVELEECGNGDSKGEETINIGDGCYIYVKCEDCEEASVVSDIGQSIGKLLFTNAYASTKSSKVTKGYGDRYYKVTFKVYIGSGGGSIELENHYKLSSSGITERYGVSGATAVGYGISLSEAEPIITDKYATKVGASDTNMYCKYKYSSNVEGVTTTGTYYINSSLKYLSKNASKKTITLKQVSKKTAA